MGTLSIPLFNLELQSGSSVDLEKASIVELPTRKRSVTFHAPKYELRMEERPNEEWRRSLDRALVIFKLFKDGIVLANEVVADSGQRDILPHYIPWTSSAAKRRIYSLSKEELPSFQGFWKDYQDIDPEDFSVSRFHIADYEPYLADRYVDHVMALECLLVPDGGQGEIGFKFACRGALLLSDEATVESRESTFRRFRVYYDTRSQIVHGDSGKKKVPRTPARWEEDLEPLRTHTRQTIRMFFEAGLLSETVDLRRKAIQRATVYDATPGRLEDAAKQISEERDAEVSC